MSIPQSATGADSGFVSLEEIRKLNPVLADQVESLQKQENQQVNPQTPDKDAAEKNDEREKFPIHALPPAMRNLAIQVAKNAKSEDKIGVIALPMIGCLSSALGQGIAVQGREFVSHPNVYVYCSLASGVFKSVALDHAEKPIKSFQARLLKEFTEQTKPELLAKKKRIEKEIEDSCDEDELKKLHHELKETEDGLNPAFSKLEDVTIESLMDHGIRHGRFFICTDEATIVDGLVSGRYSKGFSNEGPLCKAWSAGDMSRKRQNGDMMYSERVVGSMVLMGQEHITQKMLHNEHMVSSGFPARFLFCTADAAMQKRDKNRKPVAETIKGAYETLILNALHNYWDVSPANSMVIPMTEAAMDAIDDFHDSYCDAGNGSLAELRRNLARAAEQATRVALVLHVAKNDGKTVDRDRPIELSTVQDAIDIVRWSIQNFINYTQPAREDSLTELESDVLEKVTINWESERFTINELQRKLRSKKWEGAGQIRSVVDGLVEKGKLARDGIGYRKLKRV